ncbi:Mediator of RNA polymerase II transcription subunit 17 [Escovopsis weberi]|uniref:Mediator of RNA polymerase II transcription subunit 17 n=1 Tax=Escovopsis weberi TaxID=150374 RepID=A0A0M9VV90_ESCWE|nr:Mediator of RNA polymerase II transcription subunit 17 [Escovopsis weberi]
MNSSEDPPLSLRPFPVTDQFKPKSLADFVARVNAQPGGFRSVTEAKLHDEIRTGEARHGVVEPEDEDMSLEEEEEDDDDRGDDDDAGGMAAAKDPELARMEVLRDIDLAGNIALLTLDSMSLLLSKQNPTQAGMTLSQQLRDLVGIGTMGMDKLHDSNNSTLAKAQDRETIAMGWTLMETNKTRDAAQQAAAFLDKEVQAEAAYWEDIISVHKAGWSVFKLDRHTLGVKFGFSEAAPEFKANGAAPMRRGDDGSTHLDVEKLGGVSETLVVTYERDGQVVGRSSLRAAAEDSSLQAQVLDARNTIFSQELWHELLRESRSLLAYDVRTQGSRLVYTISPSDRVIFELLSVDPPSSAPYLAPAEALPEDRAAEGISMALHILLSYAHRYNELMRIRPVPPHISRSRGQQPHPLLRPLVARITTLRAVRQATANVGALARALRRAGVPASFVLRTPHASPASPAARGPNQLAASHTLVRTMLSAQDFTLSVALLPDVALTLRGRSFMFPVTATYYYVLLPDGSPLAALCPPPPTATQTSPPSPPTSALLVQGTSLRDELNDSLDLRFAIEERAPDAEPYLALHSLSPASPAHKWTWFADPPAPPAGEPCESRTLEEVEAVELVSFGADEGDPDAQVDWPDDAEWDEVVRLAGVWMTEQ